MFSCSTDCSSCCWHGSYRVSLRGLLMASKTICFAPRRCCRAQGAPRGARRTKNSILTTRPHPPPQVCADGSTYADGNGKAAVPSSALFAFQLEGTYCKSMLDPNCQPLTQEAGRVLHLSSPLVDLRPLVNRSLCTLRAT